jgi:hypothetical protein
VMNARLKPPLATVTAGMLFAGVLFAGCARGPRANTSNKAGAASSPGTGSGSLASCYSPYYPISDTQRQDYRCTFTGRIPPYTYFVTFTGTAGSSFTRHQESSDSSVDDTAWTCLKTGLSCSKFGDFSVPETRLKLVTSKAVGVALPSSEHWQKGMKWETTYTVSGQLAFQGAPQPVDVKGTVTVANEIAAEEKVTAPAGSYTALKVVSVYSQKLGLKDKPETPFSITFKVNSWYARDVGMVKSVSEDLRVTTVLTSFTR